MANHPSALKRARQTEKRRIRNKAVRTKMRGMINRVVLAIESQDAEAAQAALTLVIPVIDRAASKGVLHRRNASRKISRLSSKVHALSV